MKTILLSLATVALLSFSSCCGSSSKNDSCCGKKDSCCVKDSCCAVPDSVLRHVVMFGFKPEVTPEQVLEIEKAFAALPAQIKEVKGFEWGTNNSPEGLNNGLTHCFLLNFASEADRDAYIIHPAHKAFGASLDGKLSGVTVLDYWVKK